MIKYKTERVERRIVDEITCDKCNKVLSSFEEQEAHFISFVGGYGSIFGDGVEVETVICQYCLHELIKNFYVIKEGTLY